FDEDERREKPPSAAESATPSSQVPLVDTKTLQALERFAANAAPQKHGQLFNANPMAKETFDILSQTLHESASDFRNGRVSSSRMLLKAAYHTCLTCHASGLTNTSFRFGDTEALAAKADSPLRKAQIHFVFRDFEKARDEARNALKSPQRTGPQNPIAAPWDARDAMEIVLSASILLNESPTALARELDDWQKSLLLPESLSKEILEWKVDVSDWSRESKNAQTPTLTKLRALVGLQKGEDLLPFHFHLVRHLRARNELSRLAGKAKLPALQRAETMHLLGLIYRAQDNDLFLGFADAYFSSCIRLAPRSAPARRCFQSLRASVVESNTGSSGTHLGPEETELLSKMGTLAGVSKPLP
ncbi:MAG: hypothetical protein ING65_00550, partial [Rhodocyclaceae bacterium]|nr:hypothetical protein [Rhodocyclaceae bacterium]